MQANARLSRSCYHSRVSDVAKKLFEEALKLDERERSLLALRMCRRGSG